MKNEKEYCEIEIQKGNVMRAGQIWNGSLERNGRGKVIGYLKCCEEYIECRKRRGIEQGKGKGRKEMTVRLEQKLDKNTLRNEEIIRFTLKFASSTI